MVGIALFLRPENGARAARCASKHGESDGQLSWIPPMHTTNRLLAAPRAPIPIRAPALAAAGRHVPERGPWCLCVPMADPGSRRDHDGRARTLFHPTHKRHQLWLAVYILAVWGGEAAHAAEARRRSTRRREGHSAAGQQSGRYGVSTDTISTAMCNDMAVRHALARHGDHGAISRIRHPETSRSH